MLYVAEELVGMGGLCGIQWENRLAEISLILDPYVCCKGLGSEAVDLLLLEAFGNMGLKTIFGECYMCNPAWQFWKKMKTKYSGQETILPNRKLWEGRYYDSLYFSIDADSIIQPS